MPTIKRFDVIMSTVPKLGFIGVGQNDNDGVQLVITMKNEDGTLFTPSIASTLAFYAVKADGKSVILHSTDPIPKISLSGNTVTVTLTQQVLAVAGVVVCKIIITDGTATTSSQRFTLACAEDVSVTDLTSSNEFQSLTLLLDHLASREAEFDAIKNGSPYGVFPDVATLSASVTTAEGRKRIYVVSSNSHWYYWNGSTWADGGLYQTPLGEAKAAQDAAEAAKVAAQNSAFWASSSAQAAVEAQLNSETAANLSVESKNQADADAASAQQALSDILVMRGASNGIATLDSNGKLTPSQIPALSINDVFTVANTTAMLALTAQRGDVALIKPIDIITDSYILSTDDPTQLVNWKKLGVSYVAESGHATSADTATNATMVNNKRFVSMVQSQYDIAVIDSDTFYYVDPTA